MPPDPDDPLAAYVEEVALFFEQSGLPRIAGRVLGLLLVCDPRVRSAAELADELGVSKGSISTMTRLLVRSGLIEKVGIPGERTTYFRLRDDGFESLFAFKLQALVSFRPLADRGLQLLGEVDPSADRSHRLRVIRALYAFFEREMPVMLDKWRDERETLIAAVPGVSGGEDA
jgi:DNA-binding MarR family transcriptional regulator